MFYKYLIPAVLLLSACSFQKPDQGTITNDFNNSSTTEITSHFDLANLQVEKLGPQHIDENKSEIRFVIQATVVNRSTGKPIVPNEDFLLQYFEIKKPIHTNSEGKVSW